MIGLRVRRGRGLRKPGLGSTADYEHQGLYAFAFYGYVVCQGPAEEITLKVVLCVSVVNRISTTEGILQDHFHFDLQRDAFHGVRLRVLGVQRLQLTSQLSQSTVLA